jgi:hypothetical protein
MLALAIDSDSSHCHFVYQCDLNGHLEIPQANKGEGAGFPSDFASPGVCHQSLVAGAGFNSAMVSAKRMDVTLHVMPNVHLSAKFCPGALFPDLEPVIQAA